MILRPSPGRLRAMVRDAGKIRTGTPTRPSTTLRPRAIHTTSRPNPFIIGRRHITTSSRPTTLFFALLKRTLIRTTRAFRLTLNRPQAINLHPLFTALKSLCSGPSYTVRSKFLKGAIDAFRTTASRTTPAATKQAYSRLNTSSVSFARGTLSGFGPRPSAGPLSISPLRGGVGLQSSRKFSSGGARVFDNLIVNAPLALRLAGDEVEDKSRMLRGKTKASIRRANPTSARRTGAAFTDVKLPRNAFGFATHRKTTTNQKSESKKVKEESKSEATEYSDYFLYPTLSLPSTSTSAFCTTTIRIRLIDSLYDALGGRNPSPSALPFSNDGYGGPRLFDQSFFLDATTALEYEHRRYLQAKTLLRVMWQTGVMDENTELDLSSDPAFWTIRVRGWAKGELENVLKDSVRFGWENWCCIEQEGAEGEEGERGLDWSQLHPRGDWMTESGEIVEDQGEIEGLLSLPPTPTLSSGSRLEVESEGESEVGSENLMSLPSDLSVSSDDAGLDDSREWN